MARDPNSTAVARALSEARRARLASPWLALVAALITALLCAHSLGAGLILDDHFHRLTLLDLGAELRGRPGHALDLFRFMPGDPGFNDAARIQGTLPWWVADDLRLAFWRPLASASHWLDYQLWPEAPWLMHLHNLAWVVVLVVLAGRLYGQLGGGPAWVAGLATLAFALFSGLGVPASWIANRGALIAASLAAACLMAHDRGAREDSFGLELLGSALLGAALLAGEIAMGALAYLGAYALILDPRGRRRALLGLIPALVVVVAWRVAYSLLGYGADGSLAYVDPLVSPGRFAAAVLERAPLLLFRLLGGPPSHLSGLAPRVEQIGASVIAAVCVGVALWLLAPALRRRDEAGAALRFWGLGALGCCIPACATTPHDRLLILAALGSSMVVARILALVADGQLGPGQRRLGAAWLVLFGLVSPALLVADGLSLRMIARPQVLASQSLPGSLDGRTLVVVNAPDPLSMCVQLPFYRAARGQSYPERLRCLGASEGLVEVRRPHPRALVLAAADGYLIGPNAGLLDDGDRRRFAADGRSFEFDELRVEVLRTTADGRPRNVAFWFDEALEAGGRTWVVWTGEGFEGFELPAVGEGVVLDAHPLVAE